MPGFAHFAEGDQLVVRQREQCRLVDHHDMLQCRQAIGKRQDLVDVLLVLRDEDDRAAVAHLVFHLLCRGSRINAVDDGADRLGGQVADQPLLAGIRHDGDAVASIQASEGQALGRARDQLGVLRPRPLPVDAELLGAKGDGVWSRACALGQQCRCGGAPQVLE